MDILWIHAIEWHFRIRGFAHANPTLGLVGLQELLAHNHFLVRVHDLPPCALHHTPVGPSSRVLHVNETTIGEATCSVEELVLVCRMALSLDAIRDCPTNLTSTAFLRL